MNPLSSWKGSKGTTRSAWARRATIALPLLCLMIFGTIIGANLIGRSTGASAATLTPMKGHVPALVKTSALVGPTDANQSLALSIGLQLRNADSLKNFVESSTKKNSATAHQHLTSAQIAAAYAPLASSQQSVIDYMQGYGFRVTTTLSQHLMVSFQGTVGDANNAFHLQINNYRSATGQNFYAPSSDPVMPAHLAGLIQSVIGLDNSAHFTRPSMKQQTQVKANVSATSISCPSAIGQQPYIPSQIATAYNLDGFYNAGFRGEGQQIALFELDDYSASDISAYTSCFGGGSVPIHKILVDGGTGSPPGGYALGTETDMELILSAVPHLASLNVYEAPPSIKGEMDIWAQMVNNDSIPVISTGWGQCESTATPTTIQQENTFFTLAAAQGQTIFAFSGDTGTNACGNYLPPNGTPQLGVTDPASQPYVTSVGGTALNLNGSTYSSEPVWNDGPVTFSSGQQLVFAGGGGISKLWPMPAWQQGPGVISNYSSGVPCSASSGYCREVPDVALHAGFATYANSGYLVYCTVQAGGCYDPNFPSNTWWGYGGTEAATDMWAAFMALTNEKILHDGGFNIGFINPYLYQIGQNAGSTSYTNDFHDITIGNNDGLNDGKGIYPATSNYDMASGLGSYNAWNLGQDLEKLAIAQGGSRGAPANTTWYFAEGSVGGGFTEYLTLLNPSATQTANVIIWYLFENQGAVLRSHSVAPSTRFTTTVNDDLGIPASAPQQAISAILTSGVPIVAERPMYFNRPADLSASGTNVLGATDATKTTFYFAAGDTNQTSSDSSKEFMTILNPSKTAAAMITATYYSGGVVVDTETLGVAPLHRGTITTPYHGLAAVKVTSDIGVVVERPIYYHSISVPTAGGTVTGAASTVAATTPGNDWLFAEGHSADNFQENLVLANFDTVNPTTATINLEYTNGTVQHVPVTVNAESQLTFDVNNAYLHPVSGCGCTPTADVSIEVTSASPIVAERVMYFHYKGTISGVTDVVGEPGPSAHSTYSFAEGYTNNSFEEWLTLQNPNASSEVVAITLFFDGTILQKEVTLPAHSRTTFNINSIVVPVANVYPLPGGGDGYNVSIDVQVFGGGTVVAERPLYFNYNGTSPGGTDVIGYTGN